MINLENVTKRFAGGATAVDDVSLEIRQGELVVLVGESGCGKTTTLRLINRLIDPTEGTIRIEGDDILTQNVVSLRRSIGYVIQEVGLFPHLTARENVSLIPRMIGWDRSRTRDRSTELLNLVNLDPDEYADRLPRQMSGGQRQRVGIARALAVEPRIMLMDEPFGAIDPLNRDELQQEFLAIHKRLNLTTVMVTHDIGEALLLADRIAVMAQGNIVRCATPAELAQNPGSETVERLIHDPLERSVKLAALVRNGNDHG
ncbi:ABC transporter ATP-binding protein [Mucisphaera calidilacus]|uniref:Choline transport ATP-binding protein OpuBA n=1 Tax=Mucisphaera calidilacus TaxID=2527982 RepID=A0A518BTY7_9BACT|nr:ABC transporter ATP-binding protein [Mucisphaera calidilacus]QDU70415.1 Choline transport ATP-binding protein OpuBA [Mucisphaera calidilacus]